MAARRHRSSISSRRRQGSARKFLWGGHPIAQPRHTPATIVSDHARAVMLVSNACVNDTRVIRAAEAVAELGFDVIVLAVADGYESSEERRNGVLYKRLAKPWVRRPNLIRSPQASTNAVSAISTYALVPICLADQTHSLMSTLQRYGPRTIQAAVSGLRHIEQNLRARAAAHGYSRLQEDRFSFLQIALEIGQRIALTAYRNGRRAIIRGLNFVLLRPLVETQRMRRMFEGEVTKLNPSIVHAHDLVMLPAGAAAAKSIGAKLIYDSHELEVHRNTDTGALDKWLRYYIERKNIKRCDAVVTVCDSIADHLAGAYAIKRPIVVMNAPDAENALPSETDLRSSLGLAVETPLAVYVGRITVGRGIDQIVEALQHLPDFHLALVGSANKPTVDAAVELATALGVAHRLHVMDPVPPSEVVSFISSGDLSVVPIQNVCLSYFYCLPNKLLESAIARLPVVVSDLPELKRFVKISGSGVIMDQTDPHDIARAIREAYENRDRLRPNAERLRRTEDVYGWASQKSNLRALYASFNLLPSPAPARAAKSVANSEARLRA